MSNKSISDRQHSLERRKEYLTNRLENIEDELDDAPDPNWSENAQASENDEVLEDLGLAGQDEIRAIDAALQRIEDGTYGICVICGELISQERLDVVPYTPFCKEHAIQH
ncbi:MAG: TraR/DksA C4-type zinc finger protein [Pseudomonadota bacterium]